MKILTAKEKAKNAIIWIDSLAKTRVKQGQGRLGDSKVGYCCLGWACKKLKIAYNPSDDFEDYLEDEIGLYSSNGNFGWDTIAGVSSLADLNDKLEWSFKKISTFIKQNPMKIFEEEVGKIILNHYKN